MMGNTPEEILKKYRRYCTVRRNNSDSTIYNETHILKRFFTWLKDNDLEIDDIDQDIVDDYLMHCSEKYARNTMVPITTTLRKFCIALDIDAEVKVAQVKAPNRDKTPLTRAEIEALFDEAKDNPKEYAVLKTMYYSGMRENELMSLEIDDVDFDRLQITIKHGKGDLRRVVNITQDCADSIKRYLDVRNQPAPGHEKILFLSPQGMKLSHYHVYKIVAENAAKAGITKKVYPHLLPPPQNLPHHS
ncbi:MAG: tyrosine-type recombinase/integrase [Thermoplasmatota archaeon]